MDNKILLKGKLIVFEGIDRSGKSSQIQLLSQKLSQENIRNHVLSFPSKCINPPKPILSLSDKTTPTGKLLREYLRNRDEHIPLQALHLLFSANRWEEMNEIVKLLESGTHVITDRYAFSGISYSVGAEGLNFDWCKVPDSGIVEPDIVFYMDLEPECTSARGNFGDEIYENIENLRNVHEVFKRFSHLSYWTNIDAREEKEVIHEKIYTIAKRVIESGDKFLTSLDFQSSNL